MKPFLLIPLLGTLLLSSPSGIAEDSPNQPAGSNSAASPRIENAIPVLPVRDLARSIEFYTNKLGFKLDWGGGPGEKICSVSRDKCPIMLQVRDKFDAPSWVWMGADVALFDTFRKAGVKVFQEPKNHSWGYEMKFEDIDGNILWLGSDPRRDLPFEKAKAN